MTDTYKLRFIANARLKDIVGRSLINNDNIAIIELIKNSKDAGSPEVSIHFIESKESNGATELHICDYGQGMSIEDIQFKWLNIAYSEKRHISPKDGGAYAGNKGIGRFSCDRLGKILNFYTREKGGQYISLKINWEDYEVDDQHTEIGSIETMARYILPSEFETETGVKEFQHGTLLVISDLRTNWTEEKLKSLRRELERFVIDPNKRFEVSFSHWQYKLNDEINKPVENKIFSELDFRTTSISASIDKSGDYIDIELRHDGDFIFKSREVNLYSDLAAIEAKIYFLNQPAKAFFKRRTGYHSVQYGSIFLFLNGFRVFPYGSEGDDWLGLDRRQQQGQRRFFGTRDLVGFLQITDSDEVFQAVSSREGLVHNLAYQQLTSASATVESSIDNTKIYGLVPKLTRKLERFVVEGLDWDRIARAEKVEESELLEGKYEFLQTEKPVLETIDSVIHIRSQKDHIKNLEVNLQYLSALADQESGKYNAAVEALEKKFEGRSIENLQPAEKRDLSKFINRTVKEITIKDETNKQLEQKRSSVEKDLRIEQKRRLFAESHYSIDQDTFLQLSHQVNLIADGIWKRLNGTSRRFRKDISQYSKMNLVEIIEDGQYEIEKIRNVMKLALKSDFDLMTNKINADIVQFMEEYLETYKDILYALSIQVSIENPDHITLEHSFRPIEMTILIDNLLVNAGKANATRVRVVISKTKGKTKIAFVDNGKGLPSEYNTEDLFERGISTTSGSGIGLNHVKQIVRDLKGSVLIRNDDGGGAVVELEI